jgi:hypothetical protein
VAGIDDEDCMRIIRLFNEKAGHKYLEKMGIDPEFIAHLDLLGISSIANILGAIKMAKYYEMNGNDMIFTVATDSMELYESRLKELHEEFGNYHEVDAAVDFDRCLMGQSIDAVLELSYWDKKRIHNLKYFTWVEQQGKTVEELDAQWYDDAYWYAQFSMHKEWDKLIKSFNERTGLLEKYQKD